MSDLGVFEYLIVVTIPISLDDRVITMWSNVQDFDAHQGHLGLRTHDIAEAGYKGPLRLSGQVLPLRHAGHQKMFKRTSSSPHGSGATSC